MKSQLDLLNAHITPTLFKLAAPIMFGALLQTCYTMTDMFWVGRLGDRPVAAVGSIGLLLYFTQSVFAACRIGGQTYTGQSLGAKRLDHARSYAAEALRLTIWIALTFSLILLTLRGPIISIFGLNDAETLQAAHEYFIIIASGLAISVTPQILSSLMTSTGDSRTPFAITALGLIANMILDPLFIFVFHMGVKGAALATLLSQALQLITYYWRCHKHELFHQQRFLIPKFNKDAVEILKLGLPTAVQQIFFSGISIVIARLVANFGDMAVAAQRIGINVESISYAGAEGFTLALSSMMAQNYGARNYYRVKRVYRTGFLLICGLSAITSLLLFFFNRQFAQLFLSNPEAIDFCADYLRIQSYTQVTMNFEIMVAGAFAALGNTIIPSATIISIMIMRVPIAIFLSQTSMKTSGIWWAISGTCALMGLCLAFFFEIYKRHALDENPYGSVRRRLITRMRRQKLEEQALQAAQQETPPSR